MYKSITLFNCHPIKRDLIDLVNQKMINGQFSELNRQFSKYFEVDLDAVNQIINAVESKIRRCEVIYYTYFEDINHDALCGNPRDMPLEIDIEFSEGPSVGRSHYEFEDRFLYQETINLNFQQFIFLQSSLFENLVRLTEILIKKVVIHGKKTAPQSIPLPEYIYYLRMLIKLGYRGEDNLFACIKRHESFLDKYIPTVVALRNRFIHGFNVHLGAEGFKYSVLYAEAPLLKGSPELYLDAVTSELLDNTRRFTLDLLEALKLAINNPASVIPA